MTPVNQLRRLLNRSAAPQQGTIVAITTAGITVSTSSGNKTLRREFGDATAYRVNDRVYISGQFVRGRIPVSPEIYIL